jgi:hypothetical protein
LEGEVTSPPDHITHRHPVVRTTRLERRQGDTLGNSDRDVIACFELQTHSEMSGDTGDSGDNRRILPDCPIATASRQCGDSGDRQARH